MALQSHQIVISSDPIAEKSEEEPPLIDITGKTVDKKKGKVAKKEVQ